MVSKKFTVGILGYGFVGKAVAELRSVAKIKVYDPFISQFSSEKCKINACNCDFVFCCVPTPEGDGGSVDLSILYSSLEDFDKTRVRHDSIFVIKSTVPVGTTKSLIKKYNCQILMNPEFLTQRTHIYDFHNPTDVVIGGDEKSSKKLKKLYKAFYGKKKVDYSMCDAATAELVKTMRNSYFATKVTFMNEIYELCEKIGIRYDEMIEVATNKGRHPWLEAQHTKVPGPDGKFGYGGICLPKDSIGLYKLAKKYKVTLSVLKAAIKKNKKIRGE